MTHTALFSKYQHVYVQLYIEAAFYQSRKAELLFSTAYTLFLTASVCLSNIAM